MKYNDKESLMIIDETNSCFYNSTSVYLPDLENEMRELKKQFKEMKQEITDIKTINWDFGIKDKLSENEKEDFIKLKSTKDGLSSILCKVREEMTRIETAIKSFDQNMKNQEEKINEIMCIIESKSEKNFESKLQNLFVDTEQCNDEIKHLQKEIEYLKSKYLVNSLSQANNSNTNNHCYSDDTRISLDRTPSKPEFENRKFESVIKEFVNEFNENNKNELKKIVEKYDLELKTINEKIIETPSKLKEGINEELKILINQIINEFHEICCKKIDGKFDCIKGEFESKIILNETNIMNCQSSIQENQKKIQIFIEGIQKYMNGIESSYHNLVFKFEKRSLCLDNKNKENLKNPAFSSSVIMEIENLLKANETKIGAEQLIKADKIDNKQHNNLIGLTQSQSKDCEYIVQDLSNMIELKKINSEPNKNIEEEQENRNLKEINLVRFINKPRSSSTCESNHDMKLKNNDDNEKQITVSSRLCNRRSGSSYESGIGCKNIFYTLNSDQLAQTKDENILNIKESMKCETKPKTFSNDQETISQYEKNRDNKDNENLNLFKTYYSDSKNFKLNEKLVQVINSDSIQDGTVLKKSKAIELKFHDRDINIIRSGKDSNMKTNNNNDLNLLQSNSSITQNTFESQIEKTIKHNKKSNIYTSKRNQPPSLSNKASLVLKKK